MKDWWLNLNSREKQTVGIGAVILIVAALYLLIWSPLSDQVTAIRDQVQHNHKLLDWMKSADEKIQAAEKMGQKSLAVSTSSRLSIVQNDLKKSPISNSVTQLVQADNDSVKLNFQRVDFDLLMSWLTSIWQQYGLVVTQMTVKSTDSPGIVTAEFILS